VQTYPEGVEGFEELRKVFVWQAPTQAPQRTEEAHGVHKMHRAPADTEGSAAKEGGTVGEGGVERMPPKGPSEQKQGDTVPHLREEAEHKQLHAPVMVNDTPSKAAGKQDRGSNGGGAKQSLPFHLPPMRGGNLPHEIEGKLKPLPSHMQLQPVPWDLVTGEPLSVKSNRK
jgi:hypothetical protein